MSDAKQKYEFNIGQLRHAYPQLLKGHVVRQEEFARFLLGPAIAAIETLVPALLAERDGLRAELDKLRMETLTALGQCTEEHIWEGHPKLIALRAENERLRAALTEISNRGGVNALASWNDLRMQIESMAGIAARAALNP